MRRWIVEMSVLPELRAGDVLRTLVAVNGGPSKSMVTRACNDANDRGFAQLSGQNADYHVTRLGRGPIGLVTVAADAEEDDLAALVPAVDRAVPVRFARLADARFEYWQNAQDPRLYREHPERMRGLSLIDNGLPPPLAQKIVDIRRNPGRRHIRDEGLVEGLGHRMWFGADYCRIMRQRLEVLRAMGGEWREEQPGLWCVRWSPDPILEGSPRELFRRMEAFRDAAFGDPNARTAVPTHPPRGCVAHEILLKTPDSESRRALATWATSTDGITTRSASRTSNPKTGEVLRVGEDLVRWHDQSDGWAREFLVGAQGLVAVRPDHETAQFLRRVAGHLGLAIDEITQ